MRVFVYWNLHKNLWSVKALSGPDKGRVIAHSKYVILRKAEARVQEAGRQRVLRERRKNVHAGIVGDLVQGEAVDLPWMESRRVTYNPYLYDWFVYEDEPTRRWYASDKAFLLGKRVEVV